MAEQQHRVDYEQHTVDVSEGGWSRLAPTGFWYLSCPCGWDRNSVPGSEVEQLCRRHEEQA